MVIKQKGSVTKPPNKGQNGSAKDGMEDDEYEIASRILFLLRCKEQYFTAMTCVDDKLGIAVTGLGANDPLQLLQVEYDNFSGFKSLAIPRRSKEILKPEVFMDSSFKLVNANDSKLLNTQSLEKLQISEDAVRLLTGFVPAATVVRRQKELLREELALKGKGEKTGKQRFVTWFAPVGKGLYREYRVNADMITFPGAAEDFEPIDIQYMVLVFIKKRMVEVPHFKINYEFLMVQLSPDKIALFAAMFASPYNMLCRFEQDNFASNYEWTKPKPLSEFKSFKDELSIIFCKVSDLSPIHDDSTRSEEEMRVINLKIEKVRKYFDELETSIEACIQIIDLAARYGTNKDNQAVITACNFVVNGLYYALHIMHHRELLLKQFGNVSEHYIMLILRCLDPDIELTEQEMIFTKMWHFKFVNFKMSDISYATNFFEVARVESLSMSNSKRTRRIYRKILECLPKIGKVVREKTKALQEGPPLRILAEYL